MAEVNTKFLANPAFGVTSVVGQALTLSISNLEVTDSGVTKYVGYKPVFFDDTVYNGVSNGLTSVSPGVNWTSPDGRQISSKVFLFGFLRNNPIHAKRMNVRAGKAGLLPSSIEILTPNVFSGVMDRQIVNVTADSNMYQNQANIVTLDCDVYICRESIIIFNADFNEASATPLAIDVTFDKYLSVEKALVENYQLLVTETGLQSAISAEIEQINAKTSDLIAKPLVTQAPVVVQGSASPWRAVIGGSRQPAVTKGNNF